MHNATYIYVVNLILLLRYLLYFVHNVLKCAEGLFSEMSCIGGSDGERGKEVEIIWLVTLYLYSVSL